MLGYLVGVAVGLLCYLLPLGFVGRHDLQVRFFLAFVITLALGAVVARRGASRVRYGPVALFGYLGILTPPIVFALLLTIACAGEDECL